MNDNSINRKIRNLKTELNYTNLACVIVFGLLLGCLFMLGAIMNERHKAFDKCIDPVIVQQPITINGIVHLNNIIVCKGVKNAD